MAKRGKLQIMRDILFLIKENRNSIKITPLIRKSNLSSTGFKEYYTELINKGLVIEKLSESNKIVSLTEKGFKFLEKYRSIIDFIDEFEL
jgi:predicted transcriptional regulator